MDPMAANPPPGFHPFEPERYFYNSVGPMFLRYMGGRINFGFRVMEKHCNAGGICHGGMLFTVMDIQLGIGANVDTGRNGFMVTVNATTDFVASARIGQWVEASNTIVRETRSLVFNEGRMAVDGAVVLRANAILKVPRDFGEFDTMGMLPPEYRPE